MGHYSKGIIACVVALFCVFLTGIYYYYNAPYRPVLIGTNLDLSGAGAARNGRTEKGIELAKDKINAEGGLLGGPVYLASVDNHGDAGEAEAALKELALRHVSAVIGPNEDNLAAAVVPAAEAMKLPLVSPAGTAPDITVGPLAKETYHYGFHMAITDNWQSRAAATFARQHLKAIQAVVLYDSSDVDSYTMGDMFSRSFVADGSAVTRYDLSNISLADVVAKQQEMPGQAFFVPLDTGRSAAFIAALRQAGIMAPVVGTTLWDGEALGAALGPELAVEVYYSSQYANDPRFSVAEDFAEKYYEKYGELPDSDAALGYDAFLVVAEAIRQGQSADAKRVAQALSMIENFQTATGELTIDTNHDAIKRVAFYTLYEGKPTLVGRILP